MASDMVGASSWRFAQASIARRNSGAARRPIIGYRPVAGLPLFFGLADIDMVEKWFRLKCEPRQGILIPALTRNGKTCRPAARAGPWLFGIYLAKWRDR